MKKRQRFLWIVFMIMIIAGCSNPSGGAGGGEKEDTADSILSSLSVDSPDNELVLTTNAGDTDGDGEDNIIEETISDPAAWHPLQTEYAVFSDNDEVLCLGVNIGGFQNTFYEDYYENYEASHPVTGDQSVLGTMIKKPVIADFDADGIEETVILYFDTGSTTPQLKAQVIDGTTFSEEITITGATLDISIPSTTSIMIWTTKNISNYEILFAESCSVDNDDNAEIVVGAGTRAHVLDIAKSSGNWQISVTSSRTLTENITGMAAGDVNGDFQDELVLALGKRYAVYSGNFQTYFNSLQEYSDLNQPNSTCSSTAVCGDFNGDRLDDIALIYPNSAGDLALYYLSRNPDGTLKETFRTIEDAPASPIKVFYYNTAVALDYDGDCLDEIYVTSWLVDDLDCAEDEMLRTVDPYPTDETGPFRLAAGDVDGNRKEDLIILNKIGDNTSNSYRLFSYGLNNASDPILQRNYFSGKTSSNQLTPAIAAGNVDEDSFTVRYTGHRLEYTAPIVIAALSSAPYYSEIASSDPDYNYNEWVTSYGVSSGEGTSETVSIGFSIGATIETDAKVAIFGIPLGRVYSSTTLTGQFDWRMSNTHMLTKTKTFNCYGGNDRVIFTAVPMDIYDYEIVTDPGTGGEISLGETISVSLPRDFSIYNLPLDDYNTANGPLDDIQFEHTVGDVHSYPSSAPANALTNGPVAVAKSSGGDSVLQITVEDTEQDDFEVDFQRDQTIGAGAGGLTVMVNLGFHAGYSYSSIMSSATEFSGTVGFLPAEYYDNPNYFYTAGLYAAKKVGPMCYWEIGYWVP